MDQPKWCLGEVFSNAQRIEPEGGIDRGGCEGAINK